jgi:hypothetical protein
MCQSPENHFELNDQETIPKTIKESVRMFKKRHIQPYLDNSNDSHISKVLVLESDDPKHGELIGGIQGIKRFVVETSPLDQ